MTTKPASRPSDLLACRYCGSGRVVVKGIRDGQQAGCNTCFAKGPPIFYGPEGVDAARDAAMRAWNNGARELDAEREQTPPSATAKRDREADRARFPDADFNRWLDEGISDAGHTVYDAIPDVSCAWHGWKNREFYQCHAQPVELVRELRVALEVCNDFALLAARWWDIGGESVTLTSINSPRRSYVAGRAEIKATLVRATEWLKENGHE